MKRMPVYGENREAVNAVTARCGEMPVMVGGVPVRRLSLESLSVLEMVGCSLALRFAAALNGGKGVEDAPAAMVDVLLFLWAHAAPADEVLQVAVGCTAAKNAPAVRAALEFSRQVGGVEALPELMKAIMGDVEAVAAANFGAKSPFEGAAGAKKNG